MVNDTVPLLLLLWSLRLSPLQRTQKFGIGWRPVGFLLQAAKMGTALRG